MIVVAPAALARIRPVTETPPVPVWSVSESSAGPCSRGKCAAMEGRGYQGGPLLTEEKHSLAGPEGNVPVQRVPGRDTRGSQSRPLAEALRRVLGQLHGGRGGDNEILAKHAIDGAPEPIVPTRLLAVEIGGVGGRDHAVPLDQIRDALTHLLHHARGVRAGDHVVLDGEGVLGRGDGDVPVVERDRVDPDQDRVLPGRGDGLPVGL